MTRGGSLVAGLILLAAGGITAGILLLGDDTRSYIIPSEAMLPTYAAGDEVEVDEGAYDSESPEINDVVIFHPPAGADLGPGGHQCGVPREEGQPCPRPTAKRTDLKFIKRIVAGPGDTLRIEDGHPVVNGQIAEEDFIRECGPGSECNLPREITILPDHYFMLGDNRGESDDSRYWGPVPIDWLIGRVAN